MSRIETRKTMKAMHHNCYCKKFKNRKNRSISFETCGALNAAEHDKRSGAQSHNVSAWETKKKLIERLMYND